MFEPDSLEEFIGQENIKEDLSILIEYSKLNKIILGHTILLGPPGYGKTTLCSIIAKELGYKVKKYIGGGIDENAIQSIIDSILDSKNNLMIFIDEIHTLPDKLAEHIYLPMENCEYNGMNLPEFCLVGATTDFGKVSKPLRDRFANHYTMRPYSHSEMVSILSGRGAPDDVAEYIAKRSRYTPRVAIRYLSRILIEWAVYSQKVECSLSPAMCRRVFDRLKIDEHGLNDIDRGIIEVLYSNNAYDTAVKPSPMGVDAICVSLNLSRSDYLNLYEPFLIQMKMIQRKPRGRIVTREAIKLVVKEESIPKPTNEQERRLTRMANLMKEATNGK